MKKLIAFLCTLSLVMGTLPQIFAETGTEKMLLSGNAIGTKLFDKTLQTAEGAEYHWQENGTAKTNAAQDKNKCLTDGKESGIVFGDNESEVAVIFDLQTVYQVTDISVWTERSSSAAMSQYNVYAATEDGFYNLVETYYNNGSVNEKQVLTVNVEPAVFARYLKLVYHKDSAKENLIVGETAIYGYKADNAENVSRGANYSWVEKQPFVTQEDIIVEDEAKGMILTDGDDEAFVSTTGDYAAALLELEEACQPETIEVISERGSMNGFEAKVSTDGFRYFSLGYFPANSENGTAIGYGVPGKSVKYIKFIMRKSAAEKLSVSEIKVTARKFEGGAFALATDRVPVRATLINYSTVDLDFNGHNVKDVTQYAIYAEKEDFTNVSALTPAKTVYADSRGQKHLYDFYYDLEPQSAYYIAVTPFVNGTEELKNVKTKKVVTPSALNDGKTMSGMFCINDYPYGGGADIGHGDYATQDRINRLELKAELGVRKNRWWSVVDDVMSESREYGIVYFGMGTNTTAGITQKNNNGIWSMSSGNEPDNSGSDQTAIYKSFSANYDTVKKKDTRNILVDPTLTSTGDNSLRWLRGYYEADGENGQLVRQKFDAFDIHLYYRLDDNVGEGLDYGVPENMDVKIERLRNVMREYGDGDKPLVSTEMGWPTQSETENTSIGHTQEEQRNFIPRGYMMAAANGLKEVFIYSFRDEGVRENNSEESYGIVDWFDIPKQAYYSYYTMSAVLGDAQFIRRLPFMETPYYGMEFWNEKKDSYITSLWTADDSVKVVSVSPYSAEDTMLHVVGVDGEQKTVPVVNGSANITISGAPVYVYSSAGTRVSITDDNFEADRYSVQTKRGTANKIVISSKQQTQGTTEIKLDLPEGWTLSGNTTLTEKQPSTELIVNVPLNCEEKDYRITAEFTTEGTVTGRFGIDFSVATTAALSLLPEYNAESDTWQAAAYLKNVSDAPISGEVNIGGMNNLSVARTGKSFENLGAGETLRFAYDLKELPNMKNASLTLRVDIDGVTVATATKSLNFSELVNDGTEPTIDGVLSEGEWSGARPIRLNDKQQVELISDWGGENDLSAEIYTKWDDNYFYIAADVTDNAQYQKGTGEDIWSGDSIQFGIDPGRKDGAGSGKYNEFGMALGDSGMITWRWTTANKSALGRITGAKGAATRGEGHTYYELAIPWSAILYEGQKLESLENIGFSALVNDNDGSGRRGWIAYMDGIGLTKNCNLYADMYLIRK